MIMDRGFGFSGSLRGFRFDDETLLPYPPDQHTSYNNGFKYNDHYGDPATLDLGLVEHQFDQETSNSAPSSVSTEGDCFSDDEFNDTVFRYISQMLMEEDMDEKTSMFYDPLALQAAEKSLYDVLGEKQPASASPSHSSSYAESPDNNCCGNSSEFSGKSTSPCSFMSGANSSECHGYTDFGESRPSILQSPLPENFVFQSAATTKVLPTFTVPNSFMGTGSETANTSVSNLLFSNFSTQSDLLLQFQRGVEEASKFLPKVPQIQVFSDVPNSTCYTGLVEKTPMGTVKVEGEHGHSLLNGLIGKKNHERGDIESEDERSNKQSAVYVEETELGDMFDKILICPRNERRGRPPLDSDVPQENDVNKSLPHNGHANGSIGGKARTKKPVIDNKEVVDLRTLLVLCAQAVSADDRRTADLHLKQIRQHSSPFGDGSQRLAHCLANGLEARLAGTGSQIYASLSSKKTSAVDILKAHQAYVTACPFQKMASIFANHNFLHLAQKATTVHIIDFGILYGFQWPPFIFRLSKRAGGPPKLRITGIELPQRGFRPAERVQETGRLLAKCCERFNVPFEYNGIAQKWETIQLEDLKLRNDELVAVNCMFRFKHLLDETVVINNPRDSVLKLIRKINPALFIHSVVNGSFNAPFFVTRFREALFHYSAMFDAFDTNLDREDPMRLMYEKEFFGREVINIIACEGTERIERPETYKQWQVRNMRAGFKQVPLEQLLVRKLLFKLKEGYQDDFVVDEDGQWMIQGWKGRILFASSGWVPA